MTTDIISKIEIDELERLCISPSLQKFSMIWRSATEVNWDLENQFLYSPKPREWSYEDWFKHIVNVVKENYDCALLITNDTQWVNVLHRLKIVF